MTLVGRHMQKNKPSVSVASERIEANAAAMRALERDERFLRRIEGARKSLRAGRGTRLEDIEP
jgi:hypothetical protein